MTISVGFGRTDLTPGTGIELAGFGPFLRRRATHVLEPLAARAIAVDGADGPWVLVSCDLLGIDEALDDRVRRLAATSTGLAPDAVVVHATHAHSSPATIAEFIGWGEPDRLYLEQLPARIAAAARLAVADLGPAELAVGSAPLDGFAYNRMRPSPGRSNRGGIEGTWRTAEPELGDSHVEAVRVTHQGRLRGFVLHYSCHPVVCCEETTAVHGDFPAVALRELERSHPGATGVFLQGALGDLNPTFAHAPADESYAALEIYGRRFADAAQEALDAAAPVAGDRSTVRTAELGYELAPPPRASLDGRLARAEATLDGAPLDAPGPDAALAAVLARSLRGTIAALDAGTPVQRPIRVRTLALGPVRIAAANLELFHAVKRGVRAARPEDTWVLSTTGPYLGYCPAVEAYAPDADPYPAFEVPHYLGHLPFPPDIADRVVDLMLTELAALDAGDS